MKTLNRFIGIPIAAVALGFAAAGSAAAQPRAPLSRGDVSGTLGWLSVDKGSAGPYDLRNWAQSVFGSAAAGWYWTDNLKTEIEFGAGNEGRSYLGRQLVIGGRISYETRETEAYRRTLAIGQQYQFFHNAWFHPHVAAGANLTWERATTYVNPVVLYDDVARTARVVSPARTEGPKTTAAVHPFVATGFKAYMSKRTFFRNDLRVAFRDGVDEVLLRFGFGIDF